MIILDGRNMQDRAQTHAELRRKLALPDYYGDNLDALNDCLGELRERPLVVIEAAGEFWEGSAGLTGATQELYRESRSQIRQEV